MWLLPVISKKESKRPRIGIIFKRTRLGGISKGVSLNFESITYMRLIGSRITPQIIPYSLYGIIIGPGYFTIIWSITLAFFIPTPYS
jgi:hypothetical protein